MRVKQLNLPNEKVIKELVKLYNPLSYNFQLVDLLKAVFPLEDYENYCKYQLHLLVNDTLMQHYKGERQLKYELFAYHFKKEIVGAFEIKVNNSRVDFLAINGTTKSFEIKSKVDNLGKLSKQCDDYVKAFEYNYLVVDKRHISNAVEIVPDSFGIWTFNSGRKKIYREATLNDKIDPEIQLSLLTKKELVTNFSEVEGSAQKILTFFSPNLINERFKNVLKSRYIQRWKFIVLNQASILPVDIQFFFKTGILPEHIYHH